VITSTGIVFLPLGLIVIFLDWRWNLSLLAVASTLGAAAVLLVGSFGLQPGYYIALLIIGRVTLEACLGRIALPREIAGPLLTLILFVVIGLITLWTAVLFFQGKVIVLGGTDEFKLTAASPYQFRRENITQFCYLLFSVALTVALAIRLCRQPIDEVVRIADTAIVVAIVACSALCLWQWVSFNSGLPWPHDFFFSNPSYAPREDQELAGGLRVTGPFSEPSALAFQYSGFLFFAYRRFVTRGNTFSVLLLLGCIGVMLLSKSTTALFVLGIFLVVALAPMMFNILRGRMPQIRVTLAGVVIVLIIVGAATAAAWYASENADFVNNLVQALLVEKSQSSSFRERSGANLMALNILVQTGGLGIGVGSHKPSSLLLTLLSNTGIVGTAVFGFFVVQLVTALRRRDFVGRFRYKPDDPLCWMIGGLMLVHLFSAPNLSTATTWTAFGLELAVIGTVRIGARVPRLVVPGFGRPARLEGSQ
jgi:hypothetical protein